MEDKRKSGKPERMTVNRTEYQVQRLLGKGKGGYSWLVSDGERRLVLKQIHHEPCAYYQFGDKLEAELNDYQRLSKIGITMPRLIDVDREQERLLKEYIEGETVYEMVLKDALPGGCLRQIKEMCRLLYEADMNIDYFPTNFVLQDGTLYYIDYECNAYMPEWDFENWGSRYWSQTPELLAYAREHGDIEPPGQAEE